MRQRPRLPSRLRALLGPDPVGVRQGLVAQLLNSTTSFVAGAFLGSITGTLSEFPGLLVLVPAAIGLRGNIFGSLGNRLSTAIHTGTYRLSLRRDTVLGQNVLAATILTFGVSMLLAVSTKAVAVGLGIEDSISVVDLATVSIIGGVLGSVVVLAATLSMSAGAVRYGWDLDNVSAPMVGALGDVLTLPALYLATLVLGIHLVSTGIGVVLLAIATVALVSGLRSHLPQLRRIVRESLPVLVLAATVSAMAGSTLEKSFSSFNHYPALLVLVPAHLSTAGALGGILSGRLSSRLYIGLAEPTAWPGRVARSEIWFMFVLAVPNYVFNGFGAHVVALLLNEASPGLGSMMAASVIGGGLAMVAVVAIAYYGTIVTYRTGLDPDNYGIPLVSSSLDFIGAFTLILTIAALGIS